MERITRIYLFTLAAFWPSLLPATPTVDLQLVAAGVTNPVYVTHAGDGSGRLFIVEQAGLIKIHDGTQLLPTPFIDLRSVLRSGGEQGLLSVAFHPGYATNGHFYVYYTDPVSNLVVASNMADTNSAVVLLTIPHPTNDNHDGGQLQFGPDGYLLAMSDKTTGRKLTFNQPGALAGRTTAGSASRGR